MTGYTVIDFETTGLFPQKHDRVVEVGVVYLSDHGEQQGEWGTLVNPGRDVGPTRIHGITARDVLNAPTFKDLAPYLLRAINGRTIVAHNARFDLGFLDYEFKRSGVASVPPSPGLCTMEWSSHYVRGSSRKLSDLCRAAGVKHEAEHSALGDARATAGLFTHCLSAAGVPVPWDALTRSTRAHRWPPVPDPLAEISMHGRSATPRRPDAWLDRITSQMPRSEDPLVEAYLQVLEQAMLDNYLSAHEEEQLVELAIGLGLARDQVAAVHATYLDTLAVAAWADGVVTEEERAELDAVAAMLGLPRRLVGLALRRAEQTRPSVPEFALHPGDRVVFTGELSAPRDEWVERAAAAGLLHGGVTKSTKVVVAADPDSQSGKAAKARSYNVPVITEAAFVRLMFDLQLRELGQ
jgi:DNA polymerase-3 subunit epsilon